MTVCFAVFAFLLLVAVGVLCPFFTVPRVGLHCAVVAFLGHTRFLIGLLIPDNICGEILLLPPSDIITWLIN